MRARISWTNGAWDVDEKYSHPIRIQNQRRHIQNENWYGSISNGIGKDEWRGKGKIRDTHTLALTHEINRVCRCWCIGLNVVCYLCYEAYSHHT